MLAIVSNADTGSSICTKLLSATYLDCRLLWVQVRGSFPAVKHLAAFRAGAYFGLRICLAAGNKKALSHPRGGRYCPTVLPICGFTVLAGKSVRSPCTPCYILEQDNSNNTAIHPCFHTLSNIFLGSAIQVMLCSRFHGIIGRNIY